MRYQIRALGKEADPLWLLAIEDFWDERVDQEVDLGPPLPPVFFPSRGSISAWAYSLYLDTFSQGTSPNLIAVIPRKLLGGELFGTWEGTAWYEYQIAILPELGKKTMAFTLPHEFGHLLGLPDHFWPPTCIMAQIPWWLSPLSLRGLCSKCKKLLKGTA